MERRPPFLIVPKGENGEWPNSKQYVGNEEYVSLGGSIYLPSAPEVGELTQAYEYWHKKAEITYDEQNAWIYTVGENCASILRETSDIGDDVILDLACGSGLASVGLRQHLPEIKVVGVDISRTSIERAMARSLLNQNTLFAEANALNIPVANNSVDHVIGSLFINHILPSQRSKLYAEIQRVSKLDARVILINTPRHEQAQTVIDEMHGTFDKVEVRTYKHFSQNAPKGFDLQYIVAK